MTGVDNPRLDALYLLGNPVRLQIVSILSSRRDATGTELARLVGLAQETVSFHLGRMWRAGLVSCSQDGSSVPYRLNLDAFAELADAVRDLACPGGVR